MTIQEYRKAKIKLKIAIDEAIAKVAKTNHVTAAMVVAVLASESSRIAEGIAIVELEKENK